MTTLFVTTASKLLAHYTPRCTSFTFDPHRPFGQVIGDIGESLLNLGTVGVLFVMAVAGECTNNDVDAILHLSGDREEFWRWVYSLKHTHDGSFPQTAEQRALKEMDEQVNANLYRLLGMSVPPCGTVVTHH